MKRITALIFIIVIIISGCDNGKDVEPEPEVTQEAEPTPYPLLIGDVEITESPKSVISLSPSLSEIVYELGFGDKIIGRSGYCDYPPDIVRFPDVGSSANPDIEQIIELFKNSQSSPSLLLTATPLSGRDMFRMEQAGITTLTIPAATNLNQLRDVYRAMGLVFEGAFTGAESGDEAFSVISKACDNTGVVDIGKFVYITNDLKAATGDTLESAVLSCFGENLAADGADYEFDLQVLTDNQPDIILLSNKYTKDDLLSSEYLSELDAVIADKIIFIDNAAFERPSARLEKLIEKMLVDYRALEY